MCFVSVLPAYFDHGERKRAFKSAGGFSAIFETGIKWILINWGLPILAFGVTITQGFESAATDREIDASKRTIGILTRNLNDATNELAKLDIKIKDRTITPSQREMLLKMLHPASDDTIEFSYSTASLEQKEYAEKLSEVLTNAGFKLEISSAHVIIWRNVPESGLSCLVKSGTAYEHPKNAEVIHEAFKAAGIPCVWHTNTNLSPTYFKIFVGSKPTVH